MRLAINGFGRIGRLMLRQVISSAPDIEPVAINTSPRGTPEVIAHLFKYDTVFGRWPGPVRFTESALVIDDHVVRVTSEPDPSTLPWGALGVDVVAEATGRFLTRAAASVHLSAGAGRVLITAPARDDDVTIVVGVNDHDFDPSRHRVVSGASCTTNCLAPMATVLHRRFGIAGGLMTTIHAYTRDQEILDGVHTDLRRARAAAEVIAPTKTGAARAISRVIPELDGRLVGIAVRVPVPDVSLVDLAVTLERKTTVEEINDAFRLAAETAPLAGILGVCDEPLVSADFLGDPRSCVIDAASTRGAPGGQFKILAWYDNEFAYAARMVDLARMIAAPVRARPAQLAVS